MLKLKENEVVHEDRELVEYGSGKKEKKVEYTHDQKQAWYSGFLAIAAEHGNKPGIAAWRYKDKFGVFPRGLQAVPAALIDPAIRRYDTACRIRYIKGKMKGSREAVNATEARS